MGRRMRRGGREAHSSEATPRRQLPRRLPVPRPQPLLRAEGFSRRAKSRADVRSWKHVKLAGAMRGNGRYKDVVKEGVGKDSW